MRVREITRLLAAGGTLLLAAVSTPAFGQTADLAVELVLEGQTTATGQPAPATAGITLGGEESYTVTVTNDGPSHVTAFTLDATLDPNLEIVAVTGCAPVDTTAPIDPLPCTVSGDLLSGGETEVTIDVSHALPADADPATPGTQLPTAPSACPNGAVDVTSSVTVSGATQGTTAVTDPPGNNTASVTADLRNWADLEVVSLDAPGAFSEGQTATYTAQVRNNGPCPAPNVRVTFGPAGSLTYVEGSVSSSCTNANATGAAGFAAANRCELGTLDPAETATVSANYTVQDFEEEVTSAAIAFDATIVSRTTTATPPVVGADDPDSGNDSADTQGPVDLSDHDDGCSTGGAGTLFGGLLAIAALRLTRRRSR